jgi:hypothetical protein
MNVSLATVLALAAALLMAVAIFAPRRPHAAMPARDAAAVAAASASAVSLAPPAWPRLVDPSAAACDTAARIGLVEALAALDTPWANGILRRAGDEETDAAVVLALAAGARIRSSRPDVSM